MPGGNRCRKFNVLNFRQRLRETLRCRRAKNISRVSVASSHYFVNSALMTVYMSKTRLRRARLIPNTKKSKHKETQQVFNTLKNTNRQIMFS